MTPREFAQRVQVNDYRPIVLVKGIQRNKRTLHERQRHKRWTATHAQVAVFPKLKGWRVLEPVKASKITDRDYGLKATYCVVKVPALVRLDGFHAGRFCAIRHLVRESRGGLPDGAEGGGQIVGGLEIRTEL